MFTLGTILVGAALLAYEISVWWPGLDLFAGKGKNKGRQIVESLGELAPFTLSWCVGSLLAMCVGGVVGLVADTVIWGAGWLGDAAYVWGVGGTRQAAPMAGETPLTAGGLFMAVIVLVVFLARRGRGATGSKTRGVLSGLTLGLSAGVARFAAVPIASAVNVAGAWITGVIA